MVRDLRRFDFLLLLGCLALVTYGLALIYSGSLALYGSGHAALMHPVLKQAMFAAGGIVIMAVLTQIDYRTWISVAPILYALSLLALLVVMAIGARAFGSRRWFSLAGMQLQPSELAKLVVIVLLARYLADDRGRIQTTRGILTTLAITAVPAGLVFLEPDLGTAVVFICVWLGMIYVAGLRTKHLLTMCGIAVAAIPFVVLVGLSGYQKARFQSFLNPGKDPLGA